MKPLPSLSPLLAPARARLAPLLDQARQRHQALSARERRLLHALALLAAAALAYLLLIEPAARDVQRLRAELPALRTQAAQVAGFVRDAAALRRQTAAARRELPPAADVQASLARAGLGSKQGALAAADGGLRLTLAQAPAARLMRWLQACEQDWGLTVKQADLVRAANPYGRLLPGLVDGTLLLDLPDKAPGS